MPDPCSAARSGRGGLLLLRNREEAVDTECRDEGRPQRRHPVSRLQANHREGRAEDGNESIDGLEDQWAGHATRLGDESDRGGSIRRLVEESERRTSGAAPASKSPFPASP